MEENQEQVYPTIPGGQNVKKEGEIITFKTLSKMNEKCYLNLTVNNLWITLEKLILESFVLR